MIDMAEKLGQGDCSPVAESILSSFLHSLRFKSQSWAGSSQPGRCAVERDEVAIMNSCCSAMTKYFSAPAPSHLFCCPLCCLSQIQYPNQSPISNNAPHYPGVVGRCLLWVITPVPYKFWMTETSCTLSYTKHRFLVHIRVICTTFYLSSSQPL
jgi:hypothetical protein